MCKLHSTFHHCKECIPHNYTHTHVNMWLFTNIFIHFIYALPFECLEPLRFFEDVFEGSFLCLQRMSFDQNALKTVILCNINVI